MAKYVYLFRNALQPGSPTELQQQLDRLEGLLLAIQIVDGRREPFAAVVEATR